MPTAKMAFRSVVLFAFLGLLLLPEGASAIGRYRPPFVPSPCPPVYAVPACPPPVYYFCPAPQLAPPSVKPEPSKPAPKAEGETPPTKPAPKAEVETPPTKPAPKAEVETPPTIRPVAATPEPAPPPTIPPTNLKVDPTPVAPAVPSPAIPVVPDFKPADGQKVPPVVPPLSIPDLSSSTSKSSPLSARPKALVDIYPVEGTPPASPEGLRKVVFFNHADRDVKLTLGGKTIALPKKHSVTAEVSVEFAWRLDEEGERTTKIPVASPGVDLVIRK